MSNSTYFIQECPTCGRRLQVRVEYLGKKLICRHCQGQFVAADPANPLPNGLGGVHPLLRRADELLECVAQRHGTARAHYPR